MFVFPNCILEIALASRQFLFSAIAAVLLLQNLLFI